MKKYNPNYDPTQPVGKFFTGALNKCSNQMHDVMYHVDRDYW